MSKNQRKEGNDSGIMFQRYILVTSDTLGQG